MAASLPPELKFVQPFLQRANEMRERDPVIAYYCSYYALKLALDRGVKGPQVTPFLVTQMDQLEAAKKELSGNDLVGNDTAAYAHCENFALQVFINADNEDRQGRATKKTALTFLAASIFFEILGTFGELEPQVQEKVKYAKWKATDIAKCLREGRTPTPGPPGDTGSDSADTMLAGSTADPDSFLRNQSSPIDAGPVPPVQPAVIPAANNPAQSASQPRTAPSIARTVAASSLKTCLDPQLSDQVQKYCRFVISSLQYDDVSAALDNLDKAMALLKPFDERSIRP